MVALALLMKVTILAFGAKAFQVLQNERPRAGHLLDLWNRWDSLHYQTLAKKGYAAKSATLLFYPLFPWLTRAVASVVHDRLTSAFIISGFGAAAAAVFLRRLVLLDHSPTVALRAVWFFLIFPTSFFLHIGYTESLFIALVLGAVLAARTEHWLVAGIAGAFACMTRAPGVVLVPTLAVEAGLQWWKKRRWSWCYLWLLLVPLGFGAYLAVNWHATGDPLAFLRARKQFFYISPAPPWRGLDNAWGNMNRTPADAEMVGEAEFVYGLLGLVCAALSWWKLRSTYAVWITGSWLLILSVTFLQSVPRYTLTMFPIFILFALAARDRISNVVLTVWSLLFLGFYSAVFAWGRWAF